MPAIHQFRMSGHNYLFNPNNFFCCEIDDVAFEILEDARRGKSLEPVKNFYGEEVVDEIFDELNQLREEGCLSEEDPIYLTVDDEPTLGALCLHIAHDCNMNCKYCFASGGNYGIGQSLMSRETLDKSLEFFLQQSGAEKNLSVCFFGGEPLLNFNLMKYAVDKIEQIEDKDVLMTFTTNGTLLSDKVIHFANEHRLEAIVSLDGPEEVHDQMRCFKNGSGTHARCFPRIKKFIESNPNHSRAVRATYTHETLEFAEVARYLVEQGFRHISVEPCALPREHNLRILESDIPKIREEFEQFTSYYLQECRAGRFIDFHLFKSPLMALDTGTKRLKHCGAGQAYLAVEPSGDLYPCHMFVGMEEYKMGSVYTGIEKPEIAAEFRKCSVQSKEGCQECWCKYLCGGGCAYHSVISGSNLLEVGMAHCEFMKSLMETCIMIYCELSNEGLIDDFLNFLSGKSSNCTPNLIRQPRV